MTRDITMKEMKLLTQKNNHLKSKSVFISGQLKSMKKERN